MIKINKVNTYTGVILILLIVIHCASFFGDNSKTTLEYFDGSEVAFDKEAFENLNAIVKEIADSGNLTIPANLIVQGTATINGDTTLKGKTTVEGISELKGVTNLQNTLNCKGQVNTNSAAGVNINKGNLHMKGSLYKYKGGTTLEVIGGAGPFYINTHGGTTYTGTGYFGATENKKLRITESKIGNKIAGDIRFDNDKWKRCVPYNANGVTLNHGVAGSEMWANTLHVANNMRGHSGGNNIKMTPGLKFKNSSGTKTRLGENGIQNFSTLKHDSGDGELGRANGNIYLQGDDSVKVQTRGKNGVNFYDGTGTFSRGVHITGTDDKHDFLKVTGYGPPEQDAKLVWRHMKNHKNKILFPIEFNKDDNDYVSNEIEGDTRHNSRPGNNNDYNDYYD